MTKKLFLLCSIILLSSTNIFSQTLVEHEVSSQKEKAKFQTTKDRFDKLSPNNLTSILNAIAERRYIQQGESVRIKFVFKSNLVVNIQLEDDGQIIPYENLKKGEWIATVKPEKTSNIRARFTYRIQTGKEMSFRTSNVVIVLDSIKYKEVDSKVKEFEKNEDREGLNKYLNSFVDEEDILKSRLSR